MCLDSDDSGTGHASLCNPQDKCPGCRRWSNYNRHDAHCPNGTSSCSDYHNCRDCANNQGCTWCTSSNMCLDSDDSGTGHASLCNPQDKCPGCRRWENYGVKNPHCPKGTSSCKDYTNCRDCAANDGCTWCTSSDTCLDSDDSGTGHASLCNPQDKCPGCRRWANFGTHNPYCPKGTSSCKDYDGDCQSCVANDGCAFCFNTTACLDSDDSGTGHASLCNPQDKCSGERAWTDYGHHTTSCIPPPPQ
eukprot:TRINITY_DN135_c0_g1_i5.p1 TRINITY_DN135_c0_g1~~TRINITY_DN135_c0_g1_i5.p1  ORF type:complete len:274 (+),score=-1.29 TRINITY_DN135_c0_g1_i5:82-822(+)